MNNFYYQTFCDFDNSYSIIIEDDGRVAYAYLLKDEDIIADVWLYNHELAPAVANWEESDVPFINATIFIKAEAYANPIQNENELDFKWALANEIIVVSIYINGILIACLKPGDFPGFSTMVVKDGPLAKVYEFS